MCGIAGYLGRRPIEDDRVTSCLALMRRRGPDAADVYRYELPDRRRLTLLHSRLSIIDLDTRSNQPFRAGGNVIAYNGELYNYVELRHGLEREGERLVTASDTEVLLRSLARRGVEALDGMEGMWAFASFDEATSELLLARDRFGEKPLFFHEGPDGFVFGSEPKFVFALLGRSLPVNHAHVRRYLVNGYKSLYKTPEQFFQGLEEVAPGGWMAVGASGRNEGRYWSPAIDPQDDLSRDEAVASVRESLHRAVEIRLRADVPLAFCMSGGIDSNALISTAKRVFGYDAHGFTIVNTDERYEERDMVELAVRELGVKHTAVPIDRGGFLDRLRTLVHYHDAPVSTISYYVHWLLMEAISAAGYRISISGTAADELFSGYFDHHLWYLAQISDDRDLYDRSVAGWRRHVLPYVRNPHLKEPDSFFGRPWFRDHIYLDAPRFASFLWEPWQEPFTERHYHGDLLRNRMLNELFHEAVPVILHEDDRNAMYFSVENRSPFLDRHLFEAAGRIPTRYLISEGFAKAVLREAMAGVLPEAIRTNDRKVGFNAPILDLFDTADAAVVAELMEDSPVWGVVRRDAVRDLLAKPRLLNSESKFLFYLLNTKLFLEEFAA